MTGARRYTAEEIQSVTDTYPYQDGIIALMLRQAAKTEAELESEREQSRGAYDGLLQANCKIDRLEADVQGLVDLVERAYREGFDKGGDDAMQHERGIRGSLGEDQSWDGSDSKEALSKFRGES